jgi:hypothetical protein
MLIFTQSRNLARASLGSKFIASVFDWVVDMESSPRTPSSVYAISINE